MKGHKQKDRSPHIAHGARMLATLFSVALIALSTAFAADEKNQPFEFSLETPLFDAKAPASTTAPSELVDIDFASLPGDRVQISLTMSGGVSEPTSFTVDEPARIALDFPNTKNRLSWRNRKIGVGMVKSVSAIEAGDRTRVVINLVKQVPFTTQFNGSNFVVSLGSRKADAASQAKSPQLGAPTRNIEHIDFRRGDAGEGRVIVSMSDADVIADVREESGRIVVEFFNVGLPEALRQRLDVVDFATPVKWVDTSAEGDNVRMLITPTGNFEHLAYQSDNTLTIDVKPIAKPDKAEVRKEQYIGEKLSLNFQDIEVRAVLQLLADFTSLNIVVSDTVHGNITLRLKNTPWDQALDIILKTKGLAMRQSGNVILIAPSEEIAVREKAELEAQKQISELAPLRSDLVQINYAKAKQLAELLKSDKNTLLSERGNVTVDERTNTLMLRDSSDRLEEIRKLISKLDIPIRQVLIESRIVIANDDFARDLGARLGVSATRNSGASTFGVGGNLSSTDSTAALSNSLTGLNVNLPSGPINSAKFALSILKAGDLLDLELSALQVENRGEVVSNPRVITSNQQEAIIEQGTEIPYQQSTSSGATNVAFKKAVLSLRVTPQITPDDRIILDLQVSKDSVSETQASANNVPAIDTNQVTTQVLVDNGETVVLGGIYEQVKRKQRSKVPLLGDIPFIGALFRTATDVNDKNELLIFVTPKILKESFKFK